MELLFFYYFGKHIKADIPYWVVFGLYTILKMIELVEDLIALHL